MKHELTSGLIQNNDLEYTREDRKTGPEKVTSANRINPGAGTQFTN